MAEIFLVHLSRPDAATILLDAARDAARSVGAVRIEALAVRTPAETMIIPSDEAISAAHLAALQEQEDSRVGRLKEIFAQWAAAAGTGEVTTSWREVEGAAAAAARAQAADLVVVERPSRAFDQAQRQVTDELIFESHRPVVVVPAGAPVGSIGRHLAVAWKDDGRAVKALIPALRYFGSAAAVSVLEGYRGARPPEQLPQPLAERGIAAKAYPLAIGAEPFGQALLDKARELGADLLVMGAYTHSPLREMLLGGVTRYVLTHAEIPVLMRH